MPSGITSTASPLQLDQEELKCDRIYCSELIGKVYEHGLGRRLGQLRHLRDFALSSPAVRAKLRGRYGNRLPLDEAVVSPVSICYRSELVTAPSR